MSENSNVFDLDDSARLNKTLKIRETIMDDLMSNGVPTDKEDRSFLISMMDSIDRTVLGKARIKSDEQANKSQQEATDIVAKVLSSLSGVNSPSNKRTQMPVLLESDYKLDLVPGETDIGMQSLDLDTFQKL
jgi:hypothetical protein